MRVSPMKNDTTVQEMEVASMKETHLIMDKLKEQLIKSTPTQ